jgi:hypothetical protein
MNIEKKLLKISFSEAFLYFGLMFILINGAVLLFTSIEGSPRLLIYDSSWIIQFLFPLLYSIIWTSINRNGILYVTGIDNPKTLIEKIESVLNKKYIRIDSKTGDYEYEKKTKWARFFNYFFRENIRIRAANEGVRIFAKKTLLDSIETKIKYDKRNG